MLCQKCGKNEAEVHFVQSINGEKTEALLCAKCAAESGFVTQISFTNFLQGFMDASVPVYQGEISDIKCKNCGMTLREIRSGGKAGCAECYKEFRAQMEAIIKNVQAGSSHTGKYPKRASYISVGREINALKERLSAAIENEEYEEAASLRDAIRALKGGETNE